MEVEQEAMYILYMSGLHNPLLSEVGIPRASAPTLGFSQSPKLSSMQDFMQCPSGAAFDLPIF